MKVLITGAAGFIGFHLAIRLTKDGHQVVGIDNINDYYTPALKYARLRELGISRKQADSCRLEQSSTIPAFRFQRLDITDKAALEALWDTERPDATMNLAAQAGVRYSIENPYAYIESNILGFLNMLECARRWTVSHFVYASSSSVYGGNTKTPFAETDPVDNQVSIYAATKKSNELMANVYAHLYGVPATGLRFFTVYGPWGRPDMAPILFASAITEGRPINVFNNGNLSRDFTYIDDIIEGVARAIEQGPCDYEPGKKYARVYNIGCGSPMQLMDFISTLERHLGQKAQLHMMPMQPGDVYTTFADTSRLAADYHYSPRTTLDEGIKRFASWFKSFKI